MHSKLQEMVEDRGWKNASYCEYRNLRKNEHMDEFRERSMKSSQWTIAAIGGQKLDSKIAKIARGREQKNGHEGSLQQHQVTSSTH